MVLDPKVAFRANSILAALDEDRPAYGILQKLSGTSHSRTLAGLSQQGLDFIVVDAEHGNNDDGQTWEAIHAIASQGVSPIARVPGFGSEPWWIKRMLDAGAHGIIVPMTETKEQVEDMVAKAKYAPVGERGTGALFAPQAFRTVNADGVVQTFSPKEYVKHANEMILLMPLIETQKGLDNIESIAAIQGVDVIFVGPFDLAESMGNLSRDDPKVVAGIKRIHEVAKAAGKRSMIWAPGTESLDRIKEGYDMVLVGMDTMAMTDALTRDLRHAGAKPKW